MVSYWYYYVDYSLMIIICRSWRLHIQTCKITHTTLYQHLGFLLNCCDYYNIILRQVRLIHCPTPHLGNINWLTFAFLLPLSQRLQKKFDLLSDDAAVKNRLSECLETILNKAQEPPKSKKVQHSNAKNAVLFEAINLIIHMDSDPNLLVRACNQLGQFLQHRETNLRYVVTFWISLAV